VTWIRATTPGGAGTTVTSPYTELIAGTFYYRPHYNATIGGCDLIDGTETTVTVYALPTITGVLTVCVGSTTQLTGSGTPAVTNPWVSSNPAVATVSNTGLVTGVSAGTSIITYTDINGCSKTVTVTVYATPTITGVLTVCVGSTTQLTGSGTPAVTNPWVSSNPAVATVSNTGLVTGVSAGTSVITYTDINGCSKTATVTVYASPTITGVLTVCVGSTTQLTGSGTPAATNPWVSSNPAVATVSNTGLVTGVSAGTSVITYTDINGCSKTATVTVYASPTITGVLTVCVGSTTQLTGSGTPAVTNPWVSSNPAVATVSNTGLVTGVSAGTSIITYTDINGCSNSVTVTVNSCYADIAVIKTGAPEPITPGQTITYTITITNNGPTTAPEITLTDNVPVQVLNPEFSIDGGITWNVWTGSWMTNNLAIGSNITILIRGQVACILTVLTNTAHVELGTLTDPDLSNNTSTWNSTINDPPPTFTLTNTAVSYCANNINTAIYNPNPTPLIIPEYDDITVPRPEYYLFSAGSTIFDLDPIINNFNDNCCADNQLVLHWRIVFSPTPDPSTILHLPITKPAITDQVGQPSEYGNIEFPADGVYFTDTQHFLYYSLEDCNGNLSAEQMLTITIKPRPNVIKQ
jgi:uncharacterized repeat protein (TIGR01451 family)